MIKVGTHHHENKTSRLFHRASKLKSLAGSVDVSRAVWTSNEISGFDEYELSKHVTQNSTKERAYLQYEDCHHQQHYSTAHPWSQFLQNILLTGLSSTYALSGFGFTPVDFRLSMLQLPWRDRSRLDRSIIHRVNWTSEAYYHFSAYTHDIWRRKSTESPCCWLRQV